MSLKVHDRVIRLTVRDLLLPQENKKYTAGSFPMVQRGIAGKYLQKRIQENKQDDGSQFFREYAVEYSTLYENYSIHIRGKIDGVYKKTRTWRIEEIKSVVVAPKVFRTLSLADIGAFSEQILFYCLFLDKTVPDVKLKPVLILGNLASQQVRSFKLKFDPSEIEDLLYERLRLIIDSITLRDTLINRRIKILNSFEYPFEEKRVQQEKLIDEVNIAIENQRHLLISAPTGSGKTAAVLYPAVKFALTQGKKVFFATAKNTQQRIVHETFLPFKGKDLDLSVIFLRAARKLCLNHIFFCHEDYCPYVKDLNDRFYQSQLAQNLREDEIVTPDRVMELGRNHSLCPSEILYEHARSADCIVGDYNYVFSPSGSIRQLFMGENSTDWILIIDEAHNLYQRGLEHLSARLSRAEIKNVLRLSAKSKNRVISELKKTFSALKKILDSMHEEGRFAYSEHSYYEVDPDIEVLQEISAEIDSVFLRYQIEKVTKKSVLPEDPVEDFYYGFRHFISVLSRIDNRFKILYRADNGGSIQIQCCDPSLYLGQIVDSFHSVVAMSATIEPLDFYRSVLGFETARTRTVSLDSPFMNKNRRIIIVPETSTRYRHRTAYYPRYAEIIRQVIGHRRGNYIAFFPSFEFLQNVNLFLGDINSERLIQRKEFGESERSVILEKFNDTDDPHLLLAVLGGIFSESIDLKGDTCIGVIIFSPALPNVSLENEIIRYHYDQISGDGFERTYIIPGMNKVIQAAGRLIRSDRDRGVIVIVGERFNEESLNRLFPDYWFKNPGDVIFTTNFDKVLEEFWQSFPD